MIITMMSVSALGVPTASYNAVLPGLWLGVAEFGVFAPVAFRKPFVLPNDLSISLG